jgi:hypothetical protein
MRLKQEINKAIWECIKDSNARMELFHKLDEIFKKYEREYEIKTGKKIDEFNEVI